MTILFLEEDDYISNFFFKIFSVYNLKFYHTSCYQRLESYLKTSYKDNDILLVNALVKDRDMFSFSAYLKRKLSLSIPIIVYTNHDIIQNALRASQSGVTDFFALPALPFDIIHILTNSMKDNATPNQDSQYSSFLKKSFNNNTQIDIPKGVGNIFREFLEQYFKTHVDITPPNGLYERIMREIEPHIIDCCLNYTGGNRIKAAEILGINRNTLRKKMHHYELDCIDGTR